MLRRLFDIVFALIGLLVFMVPGACIAALIYAEDRGSVFFRQTRYGRNKQPFTILKFRTMHNEVVTRVGSYLRRTGIDEVLQFINVLRGEMSMVGPRPLPVEDIERYDLFAPAYDLRWTVKPGVTGPGQLYYNKFNGAGPWLLDCHYIRHNTRRQDFCIILVSFAANLLGKQKIRRWLWRRKRSR